MKNFMMMSWLRSAAVGFACAAGLGGAFGQDNYPSKAVRILVPFAPGGGTDTLARILAERLTDSWKVPVIVENKPGGNTIIAAEAASRAAPDGYTLFVAIDSTLAMNPSLYSKLPYDPVKDFAPVVLATSMPMLIAAHPTSGPSSFEDLKAQASKRAVAYAHGALPAQVAGELLKAAASIDLLGVPYKGSGPAMADVIGGSVPVIIDALGPAVPHVTAKRVKALAVTSGKRSPVLPDVPTVAELGVAGFDLVTWTGIVVPAGVPKERIAKLNADILRVLALPETKAKFDAMGIDIVGSTPEAFAEVISKDSVKFDRIIKSAGIVIR